MKTINIIGCGKVGSLMGALLSASGLYRIQHLYSRRLEQACAASAFIGQGQPIDILSEIAVADLYCLSVSDDAIATVCEQLVAHCPQHFKGSHRPLIFHCSGALAAQSVLQSAAMLGADIGSLHFALSISDPKGAFQQFPGTFCAIERTHPQVCSVLQGIVEAIGGHPIYINPEHKLVYHAALITASNFIPVLIQSALTLLATADIDEETGLKVIQPLVKSLIESVFKQGPIKAATGPVVRGEYALLEQQLRALSHESPALFQLYSQMSGALVSIAERRGELAPEVLARLKQLIFRLR